MKFRNFTLLLGASLALATSAQAENVALGKTVHASSIAGDNKAESAVDNNLGTRWESKQADGDNQWFYVDLGKETMIDHLKIVWEGAYGKHYKIHVADDVTTEMYLKLTDDDKTNDFAEGWTEIAEIDKSLSGFPATETITPSESTTTRYVAIELIERGTQWGFSFYEFGVYDTAEEVAKLSSIEISADKLEGSTADTFTLGYKFLDQYKMNYILTAEENASRQFIVSDGATLNDNKLTVTSRGTYTVKMKIGDVESNELKIDVKADGANLALGKTIVSATEGSTNPENAVDGNLGSLWTTPEPAGVENHEYDAELVVDLGEVYDVNCVHTFFEGAASADYTITFSTDNVTFSDPIAAFTVTNGIGGGGMDRHDWLTSNDAIKARYVKFHSTRAATDWGTKLYELEVYTNSKSELTSAKISADKECGLPGDYTFTLSGVDQFGGNFDLSSDNGSWTASDGSMNGNVLTADEAGTYEVYYTTEGGIQSNTVTINVVDPKGDNLALNRPVTVSDGDQTGDSNPESAVDGVDAASSVWGAAEPAGSIDHTYDCWIVVELEKTFKIDAVKTSWEGANSCQYTVAASTDGENFTTFGTYDKAAKQEFRTDWFAGNGIEAKYIKLHSTKASTGYGTKLQEIYVYDVDGTTSSVAAIAADGKIFVAGNEVVLPEGTVEATVYNLNGAAVARATEGTLSIANLQAGVYVVKAMKADGTVVAAKIVK